MAQFPLKNGLIQGTLAGTPTSGTLDLSGLTLTVPVSALRIGTSVQAYDADLTTWAGVTPGAGITTFLTTPSGANLASALTSALPESKGGTGLTALGTGIATALGVTTNAAGGFTTTDGTATLSGKTLTAPKFADLGFIADANGNELLILDTVASAVNELTLANAATGASPTFTASGGDTNIGVTIFTKGSGTVVIQADNIQFKSRSGGTTWYSNTSGVTNWSEHQWYYGNTVESTTGRWQIKGQTAGMAQIHYEAGTAPATSVAGDFWRDASAVKIAGPVAVVPVSGTPAYVGGTITTDTTTTGNVGAGEDTLQTYTVPASTLGTNGHGLSFRISGTIANTINAKRIKLKFGATTFFDTGAAGIPASMAINYVIEGQIIRTGATTQKCNASMTTNNATLASYAGYSTAAETLSGTVVLLMTGEAVSDNDIVKETFKLLFQP